MIRRIFSSLPTFKTIEFKPGLNVLLSDKTETSTQKQTRNSAGKSSIVEIIHFLLGSDANKESIFHNDFLVEHEFGMEFDLGGLTLSVYRSGSSVGTVRVLYLSGDLAGWPRHPFVEETEIELSNRAWREILGSVMFRLSPRRDSETTKYRPTFRALFSYFARRQSGGGFIDATRQSEKQQTWDSQVMIAYLLDLDWQLMGEFQTLRDREKALVALRKAAGTEFSRVIGKAADLRGELASAEEKAKLRRGDINSFHVIPTYNEYHDRAEKLSREFTDLRFVDQADRQLAEDLRKALESEEPPKLPDLDKLYKEVNVVLPEIALRRFDEVRAFHESVIANRQSYLRGELAAAEARMAERSSTLRKVDRERAEVFKILQSGGALEDLTAIQVDFANKEAEVTALRNRYDAAMELESTKAMIGAERAQLLVRVQRDLVERESGLKNATVTISRITSELYETSGTLRIDPSMNGLDISVQLQGGRGKGIGQMAIFAFDVMLSLVTAQRSLGPKFLVHDSHVFDGVDQRQRAAALMTGKKSLVAVDWQYIVLLNSDEFPTEDNQPAGFDATADILPIRLTDESETGGLFGLRFD